MAENGALRFVVGERAFAGAYDENGNLAARIVDGMATILGYDAENHLVSVSGGVNTTFVYDGDGNRVKSTINSNLVTSYLGNYYEYEVLNGTTVTQRFYYYAGSTRVAVRTGVNGTLNFLLGDHLGSQSITADIYGQYLAELRYYPWGGVRYSSGNTPTNFRFTGQRLESSFNLYYYGARWYDSVTGRFAQADPIIPDSGNSQSFDHYQYVLNNPMKYIDPSGLHYCDSKYADPEECAGYNSDREISPEDLQLLALSVWIESSEGTHSEEAIEMISETVINRYLNYYSPDNVFVDPFHASFYDFVTYMGLSGYEIVKLYSNPENGNYESFNLVKDIFYDEYNEFLMNGEDSTNGAIFFVHASQSNTGTVFSTIQETRDNLITNSDYMMNNYTSQMANAHGQLYPFTYAISKPYFVPNLIDPISREGGWIILYAGNHICIAATSCGFNWINTTPLYPAN